MLNDKINGTNLITGFYGELSSFNYKIMQYKIGHIGKNKTKPKVFPEEIVLSNSLILILLRSQSSSMSF